jgi:hypothetical protein
MRWEGYAAYMGVMRNVDKILVRKLDKVTWEKQAYMREYIKKNLKEIGSEGME